ncbi:MAG TPA: LysM peptidoglycan-binding domain-containing protein [Segeticoccus sp.]|nr:LysM peptidoglycan-binding domain-containing protein [Segeticoccus sp.]
MRDTAPDTRHWTAAARGTVAATACAALAGAIGLVTRQELQQVRALPAARPGEAVVVIAGALATLVLGWLALLLALTTCAALPGALGRLARRLMLRVAPSWAPRLSAAVLGVVVVTATGTAAAHAAAPRATPAGAGGPIAGFTTISRVVAGAPDPSFGAPAAGRDAAAGLDAAAGSAAPEPGWTAPRPPRRHPADQAALVTSAPRPGWAPEDEPEQQVVRRGDSLWSIAARHLGPDATPSRIAAEWPRWYAANRHLIGDDPGLIVPGQVLQAPADGDLGMAS